MARQGTCPGLALPGWARCGKDHVRARQGAAWLGGAWQGTCHGWARCGQAGHGKARNTAWQGQARQGLAGQGKEQGACRETERGNAGRHGVAPQLTNNIGQLVTKGKCNMKVSGVKFIHARNASLISPTAAVALMKHNTANRPPSRSQITRIKRAIEKGDFLLTTDAIGFNTAGEMTNGQNRLTACIETGIPILAFVVCGLDNDVYAVTDAQKVRTLADRMRILRSTAEIVNQYGCGILGLPGRISAQEGERIYSEAWQSFDAAAALRPKTKGIGVAGVWAAFVKYHEADALKAEAFANDFIGISEIRHCNVLKNWLMTQARFAGGQMQKEILERTLYCMDAHYRGQDIQRIGRLRPIDAFNEIV
jgi:hypothetical protein